MRAWSSSRQTWGTSAVSSYIMETTQQVRSSQHWLRRRCQASFTKNGCSTPRRREASLHGSFWISFAPDALQCSMYQSLSTSHTLSHHPSRHWCSRKGRSSHSTPCMWESSLPQFVSFATRGTIYYSHAKTSGLRTQHQDTKPFKDSTIASTV